MPSRPPTYRATDNAPATASDSTVVGLLRGLLVDITSLFRQELSLVRAEILLAVTTARIGLGWIALGAVMLMFGLSVLLLSAVLALALVLPAWLAALLIGSGISSLGVVMFGLGKRRLNPRELSMPRTRETLRRHSAGGVHD